MKIDYTLLTEKALMEVVKSSVTGILSQTGIHLNEIYITFNTQHPGVIMPEALKKMYPEKMSLFICNGNYSALEIKQVEFQIEMTFATGQSKLTVPFVSITQFMDKTNEFALNFKKLFNAPLDPQNNGKVIKMEF